MPTELYNPDRSEVTQDILSARPGFAEQWSLPFFLLILLSLFAGAWFIRYPDIVMANAYLTAADAPKEIVVRQPGKLERLFVANDDHVSQGQIVGWIESTADHAEVISLHHALEQADSLLKYNKPAQVSKLFESPLRHLGELQASYQLFITSWQQFDDYLVNGYYYKRLLGLQRGQEYLKQMHETVERELQLTRQDVGLTQNSFDASDSLYNQKVISRQDYREQKSRLFGKQLAIPQMEATILTNDNQQLDKQKEIDELDHNIFRERSIFLQSLQTLKSQVEDWEKKYLLTSPIAGKIVFMMPLQENQYLQAGKIVFFVNPANSRYFAQLTLPQNNFGKVRVGQTVRLRFDAYPYQEFGIVEGRLSYISRIPSDSGFLANIDLPKGLTTNYNNTIQYRSGLRSQALVITHNRRLLEKLYQNILKVLQR